MKWDVERTAVITVIITSYRKHFSGLLDAVKASAGTKGAPQFSSTIDLNTKAKRKATSSERGWPIF